MGLFILIAFGFLGLVMILGFILGDFVVGGFELICSLVGVLGYFLLVAIFVIWVLDATITFGLLEWCFLFFLLAMILPVKKHVQKINLLTKDE